MHDGCSQIELGINSFGDRPRIDRGEIVSHAQAIRAAVTEAVPAVIPRVREILAEQPTATAGTTR
ncbi:hypothetical protein [Nocardia flavorosea]|uniref:hypothetical protein n=1 Tax=Nocardia flavorosea TaxID=53429 RepID=UPI0007A4E67E|nr:hypothetical protein [Nocardia flavorosea]